MCVLSCSGMSNSFQPIDHSLLGSSVHGIFHTRILEWTAISFSRESSQPRDGSLIAYIYRLPSLGWEDSLEKEIAVHSSILVWKIPWTDEPSRLWSIG